MIDRENKLSPWRDMFESVLNPDARPYLVSAGQVAELETALAVLDQVISIRKSSPETVSAGVADVVDLARSMVAQVVSELVPHRKCEVSSNPLLTAIESSMRNLTERFEVREL